MLFGGCFISTLPSTSQVIGGSEASHCSSGAVESLGKVVAVAAGFAFIFRQLPQHESSSLFASRSHHLISQPPFLVFDRRHFQAPAIEPTGIEKHR